VTELDNSTFAEEARRAGDNLSPVCVGLLLAREVAYPELRPSEYLAQLDALAEQARPQVSAGETIEAQGAALAHFLFETVSFRGNRDDYTDPRNSYLNQVLERRLGLPITLSVIYLHLAEALGVPAFGVGLPGHFIVGVAGVEGTNYVDPFNAGRPLSLADCAALVQGAIGPQASFDPAWLRPTPPRDIVARMINNLRGFYVSVEDWPRAIAVMERLRALQPHQAAHVRDLGVLHYRAGALRHAAKLFNTYLARSPGAPDAEAVRQGRDRLLDELARLN
jgi:regulator of sirC expression with transglutaminase-like and TPR domain